MYKRIILFLICIFFHLSSCTTLEQSEFGDFNDLYVINSIITPENAITIHISKSFALQDKTASNVSGAVIHLLKEGAFLESLTYDDEGYYTSNHLAEAGVDYVYDIKLPGNENVIIHRKIPLPKKVLHIEHIEEATIDEEGVTVPSFILTIENNPAENLYFHTLIWLKRYEGMSQADLTQIEEELILREGVPIANVSNQGINAERFNLVLNYLTGGASGSGNSGLKTKLFPTVIELRSGDQNYFDYIKENYIYTTTNTPSLDGTNQPGLDNYYEVYSKNIIGVNLAYSTYVSDTIYLETTF